MAEQARPLGTQRGDPPDDVAGVVRVAPRPARDRRPEQLLPQRPVGEGGERGLVRGQHEREHVAAGMAADLGRPRGGGDRVRRQPVEPRGVVDDEGRVVGVGEQPGAELRGQRRQLGVQRAQPLLRGGVEARAGPDRVAVAAFQQAQRLGVQAELVAGGVQRVQPGEQGRVQGDRVGVRGEQRRDPGLGLADTRGGQRPDEHEEHRRDPPQRRARPFQRDDGVVERGRPGQGGDRGDLGALLGHRDVEGLREVLLADRGEVGEAEGQRARGEERVHARVRHGLTRRPPPGAPCGA